MILMTGYPPRSIVFLIFLSILAPLIPMVLTAHPQGPQRVPVPAPPAAKRPPQDKKDRSGLPPIPTFKDVAKDVGLTAVHIAAPEAHYVIDSTSGGAGLFDCDDDGRLDVVLINGSTVERYRAWGDHVRDGFGDLYVSRYSHLDMNKLPQFGSNKFCRFKGILVQCGPWGLEGESDFLYHNRGDGTFEEVSVKAGVH